MSATNKFIRVIRALPIIESQTDRQVIDNSEYQKLAIRICLLAATLSVVVSFSYFYSQSRFLAYGIGLISVVSIINSTAWHMHRKYRLAMNINIGLSVVIIHTLIFTGGWSRTGLVWSLVFIPFTTLLVARTDARRWHGIFILGFVLALVLGGYNYYEVPEFLSAIVAILLLGILFWLLYEKRHAVRKLYRNEARGFFEAQERSKIGNWIWDVNQNSMIWTPALFRFVRIQPSPNLHFSKYLHHIHPDDKKIVIKCIEDAYINATAFAINYRLVSADKTLTWVHTDGSALVDAKTNKVIKIYGSTQDITERISAEHELEKRNKQLEDTKKAVVNLLDDLSAEKATVLAEKVKDEALINSLGDGLIQINELSEILFINPLAQDMLGLKKADFLGKKYEQVIKLYDKNGKKVSYNKRPLFNSMKLNTIIHSRDFYMIDANGAKFPVAITASPMNINNQLHGAIQLFSDITQERQLDQAKDDFLALVSHQLQTPATAVKQFLGLMKEGYVGDLSHAQNDILLKAYTNNEEQIRIIQDLLEVARIESGKSVVHSSAINLHELIESVISTQKMTIDKNNQNVHFTSLAITINADRIKLRMCIGNLLSNAIKYSPPNSDIVIAATIRPNNLEISISDNGIGIPASEIPKLFSRFSRIGNAESINIPGTGLGLYICKETIEMHGGSIKVDSTPGRGSTFTLSLPSELLVESED